nr:DinB family protein [Pseudonocardia sp. HH130630-07]
MDFYRGRIVAKFHDLPDDERRTSRLASGWSPRDLLTHLRHVERRWLEWGFLDADLPDPWGDDRDGRWHTPPGATDDEVVASLWAQGRRTREIAERLGPGARGIPGGRWRGGEPGTVERVLLHLVQEYARHLGQLDVVVEIVTGSVGE